MAAWSASCEAPDSKLTSRLKLSDRSPLPRATASGIGQTELLISSKPAPLNETLQSLFRAGRDIRFNAANCKPVTGGSLGWLSAGVISILAGLVSVIAATRPLHRKPK